MRAIQYATFSQSLQSIYDRYPDDYEKAKNAVHYYLQRPKNSKGGYVGQRPIMKQFGCRAYIFRLVLEQYENDTGIFPVDIEFFNRRA